MWDSLPLGPHRIPAQGWWLARAAGQRWTWGRVVSLRNYPSAGRGGGTREGSSPDLGTLSSSSPPGTEPRLLSPVPTWPWCLLTDQDHTTQATEAQESRCPRGAPGLAPFMGHRLWGRPAVGPVG